VLKPKVLLFDEPLSNLDAKLRRRVRDDIRELQQKLALTVAYVTHDQEEALAVSDRIIVMSNARIAQVGTPRELYEEPSSRFVADFIGDANLVEAAVVAERGERALVRLGEVELELPRRNCGQGPVTAAIRPNAVRLLKAGDGGLAAEVVKASYLGGHMEYTVATALGELFVVAYDVSDPVPAGTRLSLGFAETGVTILPK
jgi:iron(III) transport system ATP-binding protein